MYQLSTLGFLNRDNFERITRKGHFILLARQGPKRRASNKIN